MEQERLVKVGRLREFRKETKKAFVTIETEYNGSTKPYTFEIFENKNGSTQRIKQAEQIFSLHKGQEVKINFGISTSSIFEGQKFASKVICWNIEPAGADPQPEPEQPDIQVENHHTTVDESDDLPF
jgi:hypothetical protein